MTCLKCGEPMTLDRTIEFAEGPAKAIWCCGLDRNHVRILSLSNPEPPTSEAPAGSRAS
ncbi:hypothetical protein J7643_11240 [bacterium]|nr:hypothetical protein [bacterium]